MFTERDAAGATAEDCLPAVCPGVRARDLLISEPDLVKTTVAIKVISSLVSSSRA
jgi:hypothetical protein